MNDVLAALPLHAEGDYSLSYLRYLSEKKTTGADSVNLRAGQTLCLRRYRAGADPSTPNCTLHDG